MFWETLVLVGVGIGAFWRVLRYIGVPEPWPWRLLNSAGLQMSSYSTWKLRITALVITITLALLSETEIQRLKVAVVLHTIACVATTLIVFWNNQETLHTFKQGCEFWIMNFLFLTEKLSSVKNQKSGSSAEIRDHPWYRNNYLNSCILKITYDQNYQQLETKLKETYLRLCVCFFTNIPSAYLQSHFLFQSQVTINDEGWQWLDVARSVFIATTIFDAAITVTSYEQYSHAYIFQLYKLDEEVRPTGGTAKPKTFNFWRIFLLQLLTIAQWVYTSVAFLAISGHYVLIHMLLHFASNFVLLKGVPEIEKPYVNPPYGFHTVPSFWTMRIINSISSVGTWLFQNSALKVARLEGCSDFLLILFSLLQLRCLAQVQIEIIVFLDRSIRLNASMTLAETLLACCFVVDMVVDFGNHWKSCSNCLDHYPLVTGYSFYNVIFEHICEHSRDKLILLRTVLVTSVAVRVYDVFYKNYRGLLNDSESTIQVLKHRFIMELELNLDNMNHDWLIHAIDAIKNRRLEEEFPFVSEFDEFLCAILENENEEDKVNDLKLFYWFYGNFEQVVGHLTSDKTLKICAIMGVRVRKGNGIWGNLE